MAILDKDPIVVAPTPTPFDTEDRVDHGMLARNIERLMPSPLSGFVLGTINGEENALSEDEKAAIVKTVAEVAGSERMIIAGIDNPSPSDTVRQATRFTELGADLIRVRIPRDVEPGEVISYFGNVLPRSPSPVVVIHQTPTKAPAAPAEVIGAICQMDNVYGYVTDHDIRFESWVRPNVPESLKFWTCNGSLLLPGMLIGANGAMMWLGNVAPELAVDIVKLGHQGKFNPAREKQALASRLDHLIIQHGVAGVKAALELLGWEGMRPRSPEPIVPYEFRVLLDMELRDAGLLG
ncbi:MAG: dihydrodipicolinate synthase family protein [Chloroflexi bacterium]|jgi:4-hydroxy-2-oxoglutarate aldolase|nr:dihydrodipicolinate synthase family protein [Chloroflexota bacterium]MBT4074435.1 dihydrodipicolinate synthase family protein [Chloroflexota bacterium]MBT4513936.1 dihydrodipicolinate synthase family protein [Chloroflexota bacterium]MBT6680532.1 dihydrodipicolinate synthase family protein [Chloroflexota bacterium]